MTLGWGCLERSSVLVAIVAVSAYTPGIRYESNNISIEYCTLVGRFAWCRLVQRAMEATERTSRLMNTLEEWRQRIGGRLRSLRCLHSVGGRLL